MPDSPLTLSISIAGFVVSRLSFVVSATTLILTQLRNANLRAFFGPTVQAYTTPDSHMTSFFLPVTFTNTGPVSGIVHKCAVMIKREDNKEQNYYLEWHQFHAFEKTKERWEFQDMAAPFPVAAKSADRRYILFRWTVASG